MHKRVKRRKNFLATGVLTVLFWLVWLIIFFFVPPENFLAPLLFLFITTFSIFLTSSLIFGNSRRGLLIALGVGVIMIFNYFELGNFLNLILVAGVLLTLEYYFSRNTKIVS